MKRCMIELDGTAGQFGFEIDTTPKADCQVAPPGSGVVEGTGQVPSGHLRIGRLVGFVDQGRIPLVTLPGPWGPGAVVARSTVDLHPEHIGSGVVLGLESPDSVSPIVLGVLIGEDSYRLSPGTVDIEADGRRMTVSAKDQLVLRCGKAKITLTRAGKVVIEGTYVTTHSTGLNRVKGARVEIN